MPTWLREKPALRSLLLFLLAALALYTRCPRVVTHPTLWGEDGTDWYLYSYVLGPASLLVPHTGYLQTYPRLVALIACLVPFHKAPAIMIVGGVVAQLAPVALWLARGAELVPSAKARAALAAFYIAMPNSDELFLHLTDAQWHLALLCWMLVMLPFPRGKLAATACAVTLAVGAVSGPFVLFWMPLAWVQFMYGPRNWRNAVPALISSVGALIQLGFVLSGYANARPHLPLGAGVAPLASIVADQIIMPSLLSSRGARIVEVFVFTNALLPCVIALFAAVASVFALSRSRWPLWSFMIYASAVLAAGLASPVVSTTMPQWLAMAKTGAGGRYFFLPLMAWFAIMLTLAGDRAKWVRWPGRCALLLCCAACALDWRYAIARHDNYRLFQNQARAFEHAPSGTIATFNEQPPNWTFTLQKR